MFEGLIALSMLWLAPAPADETLTNKYHSGVFILLFETSLFEPCNSDERWWLDVPGDINERFYQREKALRAEYEEKTGVSLGMGSPTFYLKAKGRVSEKGEHGHMGQYDRQFDLTNFAEFRLATPEEQKQCLTSGFFDYKDDD